MVIGLLTALLASMSAPSAAQESAGDNVWESSSIFNVLPTSTRDPEARVLPRSLSAELLGEEHPASFSIGAAAGYLSARGADRGTWFGGVQARLHFARIFAAEAAMTFHSNHYET